MRYYHGLVDTKLLEISVSYEKLPNVFIIMILPYDPFDKNRMVYTVKNQCVEDSTVSYEDGAVKIFLYTRGTEGNPGKNLIDMLKYIEEFCYAKWCKAGIFPLRTLPGKWICCRKSLLTG